MPVLTTPARGMPELRDDVVATVVGGGGGQRQDRRLAERAQRAAELEEGRAEVVAPLRDAVRLVDHDQRDRLPPAAAEEAGVGEPLGRREHERRRAVVDRRLAPPRSRRAGTALLSWTAATPSSRSLSHWSFIRAISGETTTVVPGQQQGRQLVAERLARAGRHHRQRSAPPPSRDRSPRPGPSRRRFRPKVPRSSRGRRVRQCLDSEGVERARRGEEGMGWGRQRR